MTGLLQRVGDERFAGFLRRADAEFGLCDEFRAEVPHQRLDFAQLPRVPGSDDDTRACGTHRSDPCSAASIASACAAMI